VCGISVWCGELGVGGWGGGGVGVRWSGWVFGVGAGCGWWGWGLFVQWGMWGCGGGGGLMFELFSGCWWGDECDVVGRGCFGGGVS